ncbi:MAG: hypothetical protein LBR87_04255, partial [Synergistaceae bacterium]|nr:hypothetical protein [Synergistaceae bacterium]
MRDKFSSLRASGEEKIAKARTAAELQDVKASLVGRHGALTDILKEIPKADISERPEIGRLANELKEYFLRIIEERNEAIQLAANAVSESFDLTVPGRAPHGG